MIFFYGRTWFFRTRENHVLPYFTEEPCSSVRYGRTMFFRKIFAKLFRKRKNLSSRILRKNIVVPYNISSGRTWFFRNLRKNHVLPHTEEQCSSVKYLQCSSVNFEFVREYSVSIDYLVTIKM